MGDVSRALARSITRASSRQSYFTIHYLADRGLADDGYRAYAYFRWVDDIVDRVLSTRQARLDFIASQKLLIARAFAGQDLTPGGPEEEIVVDLIAGRKTDHDGLRSYLTNIMAVMEFDAGRRGRLIDSAELQAYTTRLACGVMDALDYFIDHGHPFPASPQRDLAVAAAHVVHMLRDTVEDVEAGYFNVPREILESAGISAYDVHAPAYRAWVRQRLDLAGAWFRTGKRYIGALGSFRSRLAGFGYCARFEATLYRIKRDRCILRDEYRSPRGLELAQGLPDWRDWPTLIRRHRLPIAGVE